MITVNDVFNFLDKKYDFSSALPYDNVGLLIGSLKDEVTGIVVCLDCTDKAVQKAVNEGANLIVTHHPVIFDPLKTVTDQGIVYSLIKNGISVISAHTNFDQAVGGVNDILCDAVGLQNVKTVSDSEGFLYRIGKFKNPMSAEELAVHLSEKLNYPVKYVGNNTCIKSVAVCSGSGGSMLCEVAKQDCDAYITADVKHDVFMNAYSIGFTVFDAGHFNTEDVAVGPLAEAIRKEFSDITVSENHFSPIKFAKMQG